jgi:hypothetical protein
MEQPTIPQDQKDTIAIKAAKVEANLGGWGKAHFRLRPYMASGRHNYFHDEAVWLNSESLMALSKPAEALSGYESLVEGYNGLGQKLPSSIFEGGLEFKAGSRADHQSPYTLRALSRMASLYEAQGEWHKALALYFNMGYEVDVARLLDRSMPLQDLQSFIDSEPKHPGKDYALYSLALRHFRRNLFDVALEEAGSISSRHKAEADLLIQKIKQVRDLYAAEEAATDRATRSLALYNIGRFIYHYQLGLYHNYMLP